MKREEEEKQAGSHCVRGEKEGINLCSECFIPFFFIRLIVYFSHGKYFLSDRMHVKSGEAAGHPVTWGSHD